MIYLKFGRVTLEGWRCFQPRWGRCSWAGMGVKRYKEFSPELINLGASGRHPSGGEVGHKSLGLEREVCARDKEPVSV